MLQGNINANGMIGSKAPLRTFSAVHNWTWFPWEDDREGTRDCCSFRFPVEDRTGVRRCWSEYRFRIETVRLPTPRLPNPVMSIGNISLPQVSGASTKYSRVGLLAGIHICLCSLKGWKMLDVGHHTMYGERLTSRFTLDRCYMYELRRDSAYQVGT
jgi:hypothetical protein